MSICVSGCDAIDKGGIFRWRDKVDEVLGARRDVDYENLSWLSYCGNFF